MTGRRHRVAGRAIRHAVSVIYVCRDGERYILVDPRSEGGVNDHRVVLHLEACSTIAEAIQDWSKRLAYFQEWVAAVERSGARHTQFHRLVERLTAELELLRHADPAS